MKAPKAVHHLIALLVFSLIEHTEKELRLE